MKPFWIFDPSALLRTGFGFSIGRSKSTKVFCLALCALLFAFCLSADVQQAKKIWRIGFLGSGSAAGYASRVNAMREGLRDLGYVEGKNLVIEYRWAEEKI
jgi:aspartate aminotransferase-like enzyme